MPVAEAALQELKLVPDVDAGALKVTARIATDAEDLTIEAVALDSTIVKVHPDGTGALKKTARKPSASRAEGGPQRFIWLPRMLERP